MSLFGGGAANTSEPKIGSFKVMAQGYGVTVPVVMGTNRVNCVLMDYLDFYSEAHSQSQGGKGGEGGSQTTYTYFATVLLLVCEGGGAGVNFGRLWVNKDLYATPDLRGFAEMGGAEDTDKQSKDGNPDGRQFDGATGQTAWAYLASPTKHPTHALPYKNFAYLAAHDYELTRSASLGNHSVEVNGFYATEGAGLDATLVNCMTGLLLNAQWGADFGADKLLSLSQLDNYCQSYGLVISPALTEQKPAHELLAHWAQIANAGMVWTQNASGTAGALKILPLSQAAHGVYAPIAPLAIHLTDDDFLDTGDSDPVQCARASQAEADNSFEVEFKSRHKEYNKLTTPAATDQAAIARYGLRKASPFVADEITLMSVARRVAQNLLQQAQYARNTYTATLSSWRYGYLEPMDVVYLTHAPLGLTDWPVMITSISDDGEQLQLEMTDAIAAIGHSEDYAPADSLYTRVPWNQPVGNINTPVIFQAPSELVVGEGYEVWIAVSHADAHYGGCQVWTSFDGNGNYTFSGSLNGQSTVGVLTANFVAGLDPDTDITHALTVDLSQSNGSLLTVSHDDALNLTSLCRVGNEFVAYRDASLVSGNTYQLHGQPGAFTVSASTVINSHHLQFNGLNNATGYFDGGTITGLTGANTGIARTVSSYINSAGVRTLQTTSDFPSLPVAGDSFSLQATPYLRRGLFGTTKALAATGSAFVRCDNRLFRYRFYQKDIGRTLYLKLLAFNVYGEGRQSLADVVAYSTTLTAGQTGNLAYPVNAKVTGTTPRLLGVIKLAAGSHPAPTAYLGCHDIAHAATLQVRMPDGTVLATVGGVVGGVKRRTASAGFTLTTATEVNVVAYADAAGVSAYIEGYTV